MTKTKEYGGIDYFRMVAAFLVVGIHTSPFMQINATADFIFTRVIARVAVPFFIMATGFFMYKDSMVNKDKLKSFVSKTLKLYSIGILIYIPINLYTGYFKQENILVILLKDIVWNGTIYHLWYLPAVVLGAMISYYIVKIVGKRWAFYITLLLYIIGLFGDSYYGIIENNEALKTFYSYMFEIFDYTRNGIFFVPIFFVLGIKMLEQEEKIVLKRSIIGLSISLILMVFEGLLLHTYQLQRHDSMYLLLLPTMYFLFQVLLQIKGVSSLVLRELSMIVYIIHPLMIVIIRGVAKILKIGDIIIYNSFIHFILVSLGSCIFGLVVIYIRNRVVQKLGLSTSARVDIMK